MNSQAYSSGLRRQRPHVYPLVIAGVLAVLLLIATFFIGTLQNYWEQRCLNPDFRRSDFLNVTLDTVSTLVLVNNMGDIELTQSNSSVVHLSLVASASNADTVSSIFSTLVYSNDSTVVTLSVGVRGTPSVYDCAFARLEVGLPAQMPKVLSLKVSTLSGMARIYNTSEGWKLNEVYVETQAGVALINDLVARNLSASANTGQLHIQDVTVEDVLFLRSVSGFLIASRVTAGELLTVTSTDGDIDVDSVHAPMVRLHSFSGRIAVDRIETGTLLARTDSGGIYTSHVNLTTVYGINNDFLRSINFPANQTYAQLRSRVGDIFLMDVTSGWTDSLCLTCTLKAQIDQTTFHGNFTLHSGSGQGIIASMDQLGVDSIRDASVMIGGPGNDRLIMEANRGVVDLGLV